ncbi:MAG: hypothetical protein COB15_12395 [Flavobacteriales bacterium]|nr:MAG: hypothetical protein COB15_12395 [Flavobacteriales bacterium]
MLGIIKLNKIIYIVILALTISCTENRTSDSVLNEKDAYELINNFLIKEIIDDRNITLFNDRQLRPPSIEHTYDSLVLIPMVYVPFPTFTKSYWDSEKIKGVKIVDWKIYNSYFQKNDSINMREKWTEDFGYNIVHNVSYPIYNKQTKLAAIKVYAYASNLDCGTGLEKVYVYKKTEDGWEKY